MQQRPTYGQDSTTPIEHTAAKVLHNIKPTGCCQLINGT